MVTSATAGACDMETSRELLRRAREHHQPYAAALATLQLAMDARLDDPERAREALREAEDTAASYGSQYVRSAAAATAGAQHLVFGDLSLAVRTGFDLIASPSWPMRRHGIRLLLAGGLLMRDRDALEAARDTAHHAVARRIGRAEDDLEAVDWALGFLHGEVRDCHLATIAEFDPWLAARGAVARGDLTTATELAGQLLRGPTRQAMAHAITGLIDGDENHWHQALHLASQFGLRLIATDALEGLGTAAVTSDSFTEALRLLGAADRLRAETGYDWRFPVEQQAHDAALTATRSDLGDTADAAWTEGRELEWHDAADYAQRARGQRRRPRHGWASLTPTEQHVVEFVARGLTNAQIGEKLLISRGTVKSHLEHIFTKTGYHTRAELAAQAIRHQTTDPT
jgi:DNA-binding CsgD family transcriptional regulator